MSVKGNQPGEPGIVHHFSDHEYAKETRIPPGMELLQHVHGHSHLSILAQGTVIVTVDGVKTPYTAPACLTIAADKEHSVKALTHVVWYCVHATDCKDPDKVDEVLIA